MIANNAEDFKISNWKIAKKQKSIPVIIVISSCVLAVPGFMVSIERNITTGMGRRENTIAVRRPRRDVTKDLQDMHVQPSLNRQESYIKQRDGNRVGGAGISNCSHGDIKHCWSQTALGFVTYSKLDAATKGRAMTPVQKSVSVLWNVFFQIAATISAFPTTATGDKITIIMALGKIE